MEQRGVDMEKEMIIWDKRLQHLVEKGVLQQHQVDAVSGAFSKFVLQHIDTLFEKKKPF